MSDKNISIFDSFELAFQICEFTLCLAFLTIYLLQCKDLRYPHYFKLEIMIIITIDVVLHFIKNYKNIDQSSDNISDNSTDNQTDKKTDNKIDIENEKCKGYENVSLVRVYLENLILCYFTSFQFLSYILARAQYQDKTKKKMLIILSIICLILPIHIFILNNIEDNTPFEISGLCFIQNENEYGIYFILIVFIIDLVFFILLMTKIINLKRSAQESDTIYLNHIKRIIFNFFSQITFFVSIYLIERMTLDYKTDKENKNIDHYKYYNLIFVISSNIVVFSYFFDDKVTEFIRRTIISCIKYEDEEELEKDSNYKLTDDNEECNKSSDLETEHIKVFRENTSVPDDGK